MTRSPAEHAAPPKLTWAQRKEAGMRLLEAGLTFQHVLIDYLTLTRDAKGPRVLLNEFGETVQWFETPERKEQ